MTRAATLWTVAAFCIIVWVCVGEVVKWIF